MTMALPIAVIISISVLLFGSIEPWAYTIMDIFILILFNIWLYRSKNGLIVNGTPWSKVIMASGLGFFIFSVFQVIPLPLTIIKGLSPRTFELTIGASSGYRTISLYRYETINCIIMFLAYLMIFLMTASFSKDRKSVIFIITALIVFGSMLSVFAVVQKSLWNGKIYWFRELSSGGAPFGPFVNRNHFAGFIGMLIPSGMGLALECKRTEKTLLITFLTLVMAIGLFYSLSRGGIISFFMSTALFLFLIMIKKGKRKALLYIFIFLFFLTFYLLHLGISPVTEMFISEGLSSGGRLLVWKGTFKAFGDFMWFGTGLGTFRHVFPLYEAGGINAEFHHAHNDYLQLLLEAGLIGTLFAFMFISAMAMLVLRHGFDKGRSFITYGLVASMFYMFVHSIFDFNLHMPSNAITLSAIAGLTVSCIEGKW
jgi:O-antigen ligase